MEGRYSCTDSCFSLSLCSRAPRSSANRWRLRLGTRKLPASHQRSSGRSISAMVSQGKLRQDPHSSVSIATARTRPQVRRMRRLMLTIFSAHPVWSLKSHVEPFAHVELFALNEDPSSRSPLVVRPHPKGEPIPRQWPNLKFEQIPTEWPNLKLQLIDGGSSSLVPAHGSAK